MMAIILAAGRGERLKPITDKIPKSLVKIDGETLLERHFKMLIQAGISKVIINLGWLGDQIVDYVGSGKKFGVKVIYSPEENQILETGGGIVRALPLLGSEPFWVINADIFTDSKLPIIKSATNGKYLEQNIWGLKAPWAKEEYKRLHNARLEGIDQKVTFKKLIIKKL